MKITNQIAESITTKLMEAKTTEVKTLKDNYVQYVTDVYLSQLPKEVIEMDKKFGEYLSKSDTINFSGHGFRWESVYLPKKIISNGSPHCNLKLTESIATKIRSLKDKYEKANEKLKTDRKQVLQAIVTLGTVKRVIDNLPEAKDFIPQQDNMAVMVDIQSIRQIIKPLKINSNAK